MELSRDGMLDKVFADMYFGNGKPAITVRMDAVETSQARIEKLLSKLIWLGMGTLVGSLGALAIEIFKAVVK